MDEDERKFNELHLKIKEDVIREQAAVIDTLRQMVKVQGELIELLRKAQA